jgi:hypothetical protein
LTPGARGLALLAPVLLGACVTQDVRLQPAHVEAERPATAAACRLAPFRLVDARPPGPLGRIGAHEVLCPDLPASVEAALQRASAPDAAAAPLSIELARAHLESHHSGHSFNLVLRVRGRDGAWQVFRGFESGITWWGSDAEFGQYVRNAADRAAQKLVAALGDCSAPAAGS